MSASSFEIPCREPNATNYHHAIIYHTAFSVPVTLPRQLPGRRTRP